MAALTNCAYSPFSILNDVYVQYSTGLSFAFLGVGFMVVAVFFAMVWSRSAITHGVGACGRD